MMDKNICTIKNEFAHVFQRIQNCVGVKNLLNQENVGAINMNHVSLYFVRFDGKIYADFEFEANIEFCPRFPEKNAFSTFAWAA